MGLVIATACYLLYVGLIYGLLRYLSRNEGYIPYPFGWREWLTLVKEARWSS
jgi:hypothetical protein